MGYCMAFIDIKRGLALTKGKEVVSASKEEYFNNKRWRNYMSIHHCEEKERNGNITAIQFTLKNGDFIELDI